jgi:hypothetical protein
MVSKRGIVGLHTIQGKAPFGIRSSLRETYSAGVNAGSSFNLHPAPGVQDDTVVHRAGKGI